MRLLVFGASGKTGREVLREALEHGHSVTAFVRDASRLAIRDSTIQVVEGDIRDPATVEAVVPAHDAVVCALGAGIPLKHDHDVIAGVRCIVHSMQAHHVRRLIYLSFIGVHESRASVGIVLRYIAPIPLRYEIADHEAKEELIRASDLEWTIVRPPKLTGGPRTGRYRSGETISTWKPMPMISRADVAHFIVRELAEPSYIKCAPRLLH